MKTISINVSKSPMKILAFVLSLALLVTSISGVGLVFATDSSIKADETVSVQSLPTVINPDDNSKMFTVNSTFYDYYSDSQVNSSSTPGTINDGVYGTKDRATQNSFTKFNTRIFEEYNYGNSAVTNRYPLYCGLFFGDQNTGDNGNFYYKNDESSNLSKNFWLGANSSQKGGGTLGIHADVNAVTQGLVDNTLSANGDVTQAGGKEVLPYFSKSFLTSTLHKDSKLPLGEVKEEVAFPFRTVMDNGVPYYKFDSRHDTVRFNSKGQLDYMGVDNASAQVKDQKKDDGQTVQPGFFPYNSASDSDSTRLNYGFGVKLEIPFNMTSDGKINGQDIVFEFSGDDDVWVFIDGYLALDLGGAHGRATGRIDFSKRQSTVDAVKKNDKAFAERNHWYVTNEEIDQNVTTSFSKELTSALKDTKKSHTLTMFYMERGKIESNMMINFNLPQPNSLTVTNKIDMSRVNEALKPSTKLQTDKEIFSYDVVDESAENSKDVPLLKDGEDTTYVDQFTTGDVMTVKETKLTDENRELKELYDTSWNLNDELVQISTSKDKDAYAASDDRSSKDDTFLFQNKSDAPTTNLVVNYLNEVLVGDLVFTKEMTDGVDYDGEKFEFKVTFENVFGGPSEKEKYVGDYYVTDESGKQEKRTTDDGIITLKAHEAATITGIPVQTKYEVTEVEKSGSDYYLVDVTKRNSDYSAKSAKGIIAKDVEDNYFTFHNGKDSVEPTKEPTPEPTKEPTPEPVTPPAVTKEPTPEPTKEPTPEPTKEPTAEPTLIPTIAPTKTPVITPSPKPIIPVEVTKAPPTEAPTPEPTEPVYSVPDEEEEVEPTEAPEEAIEEPEVPKEDVETEEEPEEEEEEEAEEVEVDEEVPATSPKTGDSTNLIFWIMSVIISAGAVIVTGKDLFWRKKER